MLSRFILRPSRYLYSLTRNHSTHLNSQIQSCSYFTSASTFSSPSSAFFAPFPRSILYCRHFSSNKGNNGDEGHNNTSDIWKLSTEDDNLDIFGTFDGAGIRESDPEPVGVKQTKRSWAARGGDGVENNVFQGGNEFGESSSGSAAAGGDNDWAPTAFEKWDLQEEDKLEDLFDAGNIKGDMDPSEDFSEDAEKERLKLLEDRKKLAKEEEALTVVLKGPNRAFGDLVAASGITNDMLDSLFALKDFQGVEGLPPLAEIEDLRYEKTTRKSTRYEMERLKQEEAAKARVRQVDENGRSYGTGKRKCSIARVWIQPGDGKFLVNDKEFDVYFPMLDHRAALLRPFTETHTLGLWDVKCTVKGGGFSGQVGAIRLGISRALQNWEPGLRPQLKQAGFLTRDPRIVERKKPGKAKARKSFQWVKR